MFLDFLTIDVNGSKTINLFKVKIDKEYLYYNFKVIII